MRILSLSLSTVIIPDKLKITKGLPIIKNGEKNLLTEFQLISTLLRFF